MPTFDSASATILGEGTGYPFYFAWTASGTPFDPTIHNRYDMIVLSFEIDHTEGQIPLLTLETKNPRIGLLNPNRYRWAYLSWFDGVGSTYPLFYGRIVAIPEDVYAEVVKLKFIAQPLDFLEQKQLLAQSLMVAPFWDPVFTTIDRRLDPDSVLEGRSAFWHVDRVTNIVTTSHLLSGEDGTLDFGTTDAFYEGMRQSIERAPLRSVFVNSSVTWTQRATGYVDLGPQVITTYVGGSVMSNWPKPLTALGSGWIVAYSSVQDMNRTSIAQNITLESHYKNTEKKHQTGDVMSVDVTWTRPAFTGASLGFIISEYNKFAIIDSDPGGFNDPVAEVRQTSLYLLGWTLSTQLVLRYDTARERTENVRFLLVADVQQVFTDPGGIAANFAQDSELLEVQGSVGLEGPYGNFRGDWAPNTFYYLYDYFMVNVGGFNYCYTVLRDHLSQATFDPRTTATVWQPNTLYGEGENVSVFGSLIFKVMLSHRSSFVFDSGAHNTLGELYYTPAIDPFTGAQLYGPIANFRGYWEPGVLYIANDIVIDSDSGNYFKVAIGHESHDTFYLYDTDITGRLLYSLMLNPAPIEDVSRRSYFPTDRGIWSLEHLICRARAKLLARSRVAKTTFEIPFHLGLTLSCRQNAVIHDPRLPGGSVNGKIVNYKIINPGELTAPFARITIASAVGNGTSLVTSPGTPSYCVDDYCAYDYQQHDDAIISFGAGDIGHSWPEDNGVDDGIVFPIQSKSDVLLSELLQQGSRDQELHAQLAYIGAKNQIDLQAKLMGASQSLSTSQSPTAILLNNVTALHQAQEEAIAEAIGKVPTWYHIVLRPLNTGPWVWEYDIKTSKLHIPKQIDFSAASTA